MVQEHCAIVQAILDNIKCASIFFKTDFQLKVLNAPASIYRIPIGRLWLSVEEISLMDKFGNLD